MNWEHFVIEHGERSRLDHLSAVTGVPASEIRSLRNRGVCEKVSTGKPKEFAELFALWHGRAPLDAEWPVPTRRGNSPNYEWNGAELAALASLVGQFGPDKIAEVLTLRLQALTGDPTAIRTKQSVIIKTNAIGLMSSDVLGGLTVAAAAREIGGERSLLDHAIRKGQIAVHKVGRHIVITHDEWARWKTTRQVAPEGYVRLSSLRELLGFSGDKLSEMASLGYVPTAIRVNTRGSKGRSTKFGTWHIEAKVAERLVADRRKGLPMPWYGKPMRGNLKKTWKTLQERRHPPACEECRMIWGDAGSPVDFDDFVERYPPLSHGAKRHLTRVWTPGLPVADVAVQCGCSVGHVRKAILTGTLKASKFQGRTYITRTDATRWRARKCPSGDSPKSWIALSTAEHLYGFDQKELRLLIHQKVLKSKTGTNGPMRGVVYVLRQQCAERREKVGYSEQEAARRVGVSVEHLRQLLDGLEWRKAGAIPLAVINNAIKRLQSECGHTITEAAAAIGKDEAWVQARVDDGTVRLLRSKWTPDRVYLSEPMMDRLRAALDAAPSPQKIPDDWLLLSEAAVIAGVTTTTLTKWAEQGQVDRVRSPQGWRYRIASIEARAREYWPNVRYKRSHPPQWYLNEQAA